MEREGIGLAPQMPGYDRHGSKFPHRPCPAQNHPVQQRPFDMGEGNLPKDRESLCPHQCRRFLLVFSISVHHREQLAEHKRKCDKYCGKNHAWYCKNNFDVMRFQETSHPSDIPERQYED